MSNSLDSYGALRELSRQRFHLLWQAARLGGTFEGEDAHLVQAMRDHPEYYDTWEHANEFLQDEVTINGVNPFLHVMMHTVVENQAAQNNPPEVRTVLDFKLEQRTPRHQAIHEIANIFVTFLWATWHDQKPFDNDGYRHKLAKLLPRSKRPVI